MLPLDNSKCRPPHLSKICSHPKYYILYKKKKYEIIFLQKKYNLFLYSSTNLNNYIIFIVKSLVGNFGECVLIIKVGKISIK